MRRAPWYKVKNARDSWLAQLVECVILDLGFVGSNPVLGVQTL